MKFTGLILFFSLAINIQLSAQNIESVLKFVYEISTIESAEQSEDDFFEDFINTCDVRIIRRLVQMRTEKGIWPENLQEVENSEETDSLLHPC